MNNRGERERENGYSLLKYLEYYVFSFKRIFILFLFPFYSSRRDMKTAQKMAMWIKGALMLAVLLGVTWIFGFFQFGATSVIFSYIFVLFNSFQGIFFFFFHCLGNEKVSMIVLRGRPHMTSRNFCLLFYTPSSQKPRNPSM